MGTVLLTGFFTSQKNRPHDLQHLHFDMDMDFDEDPSVSNP